MVSLSTAMANQLFDVLIIGGGPGGLSVATGLARQLYTAVVFDSGVYRNAIATHMHNVVGHDHQNPAEYRRKGRQDLLQRYRTIQFKDVAIENARKTESGFEVIDEQKTIWKGRKLVLATGVKDIFPDLEGYGECWGRCIYNCLFCHGFEDNGVPSAGILAIGQNALPSVIMHLVRMAKRLTKVVTVYTNGSQKLTQEVIAIQGSSNIKVDSRRIIKLEKGPVASQAILVMEDSHRIVEGFLVHQPRTITNGPFAAQLNLEMTDTGEIKTKEPFYESTTVPGVFVVGDCGSFPLKTVTQAVASGTWCLGGLTYQLAVELETVEIE